MNTDDLTPIGEEIDKVLSKLIEMQKERALMGDKEAQELCTEQGVVLPCPCCKGNARVRYTGNHSGPDGYTSNIYVRSKPGLIMCDKCGLKTSRYTKVCRALAKWNTRPAPPIGHCKDCRYFGEGILYGESGSCSCDKIEVQDGAGVCPFETDYCSYFEPKEDAK